MRYFLLCNGKSCSILYDWSFFAYLHYKGIDISDVGCVIQYGICCDVSSWWQHGGRAGHNPEITALYLTLYEPWVRQVNLPDLKDQIEDPDWPVFRLKKNSTKRERAGIASIHLMQSNDCIRQITATYFDDQTETSTSPAPSVVFA